MKCAILGATGMVGQRFVELLSRTKEFEISALYASERSAGKNYREACHWVLDSEMPENVADMRVLNDLKGIDADIFFSALPSGTAGDVERRLASEGRVVCSNARDNRMVDDVPLVIPEVNPEHLGLIKGKKGYIIANPNCSTIVLCMALKPLFDFGIEAVSVTTMQALSGAGYPGVASLDIENNVIPFIANEEEKMESEPLKIFGSLEDGRIKSSDFKISASCTRVDVIEGHTLSIQLKLRDKPSIDKIKDAYRDFRGLPQELKLPLAPEIPVILREEQDRPQPRKDLADGFSISVGRVRRDEVLGYKLFAVGSNTVRGAAGAGILNAELLKALHYL